jgi:hypothetical protein
MMALANKILGLRVLFILEHEYFLLEYLIAKTTYELVKLQLQLNPLANLKGCTNLVQTHSTSLFNAANC